MVRYEDSMELKGIEWLLRDAIRAHNALRYVHKFERREWPGLRGLLDVEFGHIEGIREELRAIIERELSPGVTIKLSEPVEPMPSEDGQKLERIGHMFKDMLEAHSALRYVCDLEDREWQDVKGLIEMEFCYIEGIREALKEITERALLPGITIKFPEPAKPMSAETSKIARQLFEISEYADGWMDGRGARFDKASLVKISRLFERNYPASLTLPTMFPSLEGTILAQWHLSNGSAVLEIELPSFCGELDIFHRDTKQIDEEDLNLEVDTDWIRLSDCISKLANDARDS